MFADEWNALPLRERRRLRRMVRIGRLPDDPGEARLATGFAAHQEGRTWWRWFWWWFVPGVLVSLAAAALIHPVVVGMVLATGAQAVLVRRNTARLARQARARAAPA